MATSRKVAIIGGGISGLSAAWFLEAFSSEAEKDSGLSELEITLLESDTKLGGKIQTHHQDGMILELGAESFLSRKPAGVGLCKQLRVDNLLTGTNPANKRTFVWQQNRLHQLPEGLTGFVPGNLKSLRTTSLLSLMGKLRVGLDYLLPARKSTADESIASFISRRIGKEAYQRLVQPLLCGIYSADGNELSLNATYPELKRLEQKHGSLIRGLKSRKVKDSHFPPFVTFPNGMSQLIQTVRDQLKKTHIRLGVPVFRIEKSDAWSIHTDSQTSEEFDVVLSTTSSNITAKLLQETSPELAKHLDSIPHVSTATVNLWYKADKFDAKLDGYGFVIPSGEQNGITAVTWTSSKHYRRAPENVRLIRAYVGRAGAELDPTLSDSELLAIVQRELKKTMGLTCDPAGYRIQRWMGGSPQYTLGHLERLEKIDRISSQFPGLFLCGSSYRGVGIPDCIRESEKAASNIIQHLTS